MSIQPKGYHKAWRDRNKEKIHSYYVRFYERKKEAIRLKRQSPGYRKKLSEYLRKWRSKNKEKAKADNRKWVSKNKDYISEYRRNYNPRRLELYRKNRKRISARKLELSKTPKYMAATNARNRRRRISDIQFSLKDRLRASMNRAFRRNWIRKPVRTEALLGCSIAELKSHIEGQFTPRMSWENRRSFHIDHIVPIAAFNLLDEEERGLAFNWRNLRPLDPVANSEKSDKLPDVLPDWIPVHIKARILSKMI